MSLIDFGPLVVLALSFIWVAIQAFLSFFIQKPKEGWIRAGSTLYSLLLVATNLWIFSQVLVNHHSYSIHFKDWLSFAHYRFASDFLMDYYGSLFALLSSFLFAVISRFSYSYLHREE